MEHPALGFDQSAPPPPLGVPTVATPSPMYSSSGYSQVTLQAPIAAAGGMGVKPGGLVMASAAANAFSQNVTRTAPATVLWLHEHFESADGVSLGRSTLYQHYCDHCTLNRYDPVNQASFGKLIRSVFPNLKTRRLGTRGNSKYHYYGIRLKDTSPLSFPSDQIGGAHNRYRSRAPSDKPKQKKTPQAAKPDASDVEIFLSSSVVLPDFPTHPGDDFTKTYYAHCKETLRLASKAEFSKIQPHWEKFWASQTRPMLFTQAGIALVIKCEEIFLSALSKVLMVDVLAPMPEPLVKEIRFFAKCIEPWTKAAMEKFPALMEARLARVRGLAHSLRRFTALTHLAQAARGVFCNADQLAQMSADLGCLDFHSIHAQAQSVTACGALAESMEAEFKQCLKNCLAAEQWVVWLQKMLREHVGAGDALTRSRQFLTRWSFYCSIVIRDLTLRSAPSFGSFHLIRLFFDEYLLYLVEQVQEKGAGFLATEYRAIARRPAAPAAASVGSDGEEEEDGDGEGDGDEELLDFEEADSMRSGLPALSSFMGGGVQGSSSFADLLRGEQF